MEGIFEVLNMIGIPNIGLAIILFTIVVNLLKEEINYTAQEYVPFPATPYVNADHIEMYFRKYGHIEGRSCIG